jgi:hypothetical protein
MNTVPRRNNLILGQICMLCVRLWDCVCVCVSGIIWWIHFEIAISIVARDISAVQGWISVILFSSL